MDLTEMIQQLHHPKPSQIEIQQPHHQQIHQVTLNRQKYLQNTPIRLTKCQKSHKAW